MRRILRMAKSAMVLTIVFTMTIDTANACRLFSQLFAHREACCTSQAVSTGVELAPMALMESAPLFADQLDSTAMYSSAPIIESMPIVEAPVMEMAPAYAGPVASNNCCCCDNGVMMSEGPVMDSQIMDGQVMESSVMGDGSYTVIDDGSYGPSDTSYEAEGEYTGDYTVVEGDVSPVDAAGDDMLSTPVVPGDNIFNEPTEAEPAEPTIADPPAENPLDATEEEPADIDGFGDAADADPFGGDPGTTDAPPAIEPPAVDEAPADDAFGGDGFGGEPAAPDDAADDGFADDLGGFDEPATGDAGDAFGDPAPAEEPAVEAPGRFDEPATDDAFGDLEPADDAGDMFDTAPADDEADGGDFFNADEPADANEDDLNAFDDLSSAAPSTETREVDLPTVEDVAPADEFQPADEDASSDSLDDIFGQNQPKGMRVWTDNTGDYRTVGRLVVIAKTHIRLLKENGRYSTVPLNRLCSDDLEYVMVVAKRLAGSQRIASR